MIISFCVLHFRVTLAFLVSTTLTLATWPPGSSGYRRHGPGPFRPHGRDQGYKQKTGGSRCSATFPCSEFTLSLYLDGPLDIKVVGEAEKYAFLNQYAAGGFNPNEVIELGREAARFFKERFGVDFTGLSADKYLLGGSVIEGVAAFRPFFLDRKANYRLTSAIRRDRAQFFNKRVDFAGWRVSFENDFVSQGTFEGTVPKGAFSTAGSYVVRPCEGERYGNCKNILRPKNPAKPIFITSKTRDFVSPIQPGNFLIVDFDLHSADFGAGRARGLFQMTGNGKAELVNTFIFSSDTRYT